MNKITSIHTYQPLATDSLLFDTNVWLLITSPIGGYSEARVKKYSRFFSEVVKSNSKILITSMIISEIINTYLRLEFNIWLRNGNEGKDFKRDYRNTDEYYSGVDDIKAILKNQILSTTVKIDDKFSEMESDTLFTYLRAIDFNDHYYLRLSKLTGFKIVTDDGDFKNPAFDAEVITGNQKLLS